MAPFAHTVRIVQTFFASWRFPVLVLSVLLAFKALVLLVLFVPAAPTGFGAFAEEFKVWCFGFDPATGHMESAYVGLALAEPLVIGAVIVGVWWRPLREVLGVRPRAIIPYVGLAALIVAAGASSLLLMKTDARADELPFPAKSLRTALVTPPVALTDHEGEAVSLDALRGRVVMITGVYASCGYACPMILGQARRAVAALAPSERSDLRVLAITLDPDHDGRDQLAQMANAQSVATPTFHLLWGEPRAVDTALDDFAIPRKRDAATGVIDHANLFILVDRRGTIAYRLTLGALQERWLVEALRTLLREPVPGS